MATTSDVQYHRAPYAPYDRSNGAHTQGLTEFEKMKMRVDTTSQYRLGSSAYGECTHPCTPGRTHDTASMPFTMGYAGSQQQTTSNSPESSRPSSHFERSYSALEKKAEEYKQRYAQLSQHVVYKYPDPGQPREKTGNVGGSWRHIKEVLGHSGSQLVFVDGMVSLYDYDVRRNSHIGPQSRSHTPLYGASRHDVDSYRHLVERESEQRAYRPWQDAKRNKESSIEEPARPPSNRYKGFYACGK